MSVISVVALVCLVAGTVSGQIPAPAQNDPARTNIVLLRAINTIEAAWAGGSGKYRPLAAVLDAPTFKERFPEAALADSSSSTVAGHRLVLVVSDDQKHYQAMVWSGEPCAVAMFTNENGLIYSGRGLGCDQRD